MSKINITVLIGILLFSLSCSNSDDDSINTVNENEVGLSQQEIEDLLFLREEEKLARDVYLNSYEQYNVQIFKNISNSESQHMKSVLELLTKYNLEDPASTTIGVFSNVELQQLYHDLVAQSNISLLEALKVGDIIEDLDIKDLSLNEARTSKADLLLVYSSLKCGSRNHLRSFNNLVIQNGGLYEPSFISQAEFEAIVSTDNEKCNSN